ncbi:MAG: hypothetical protein KUG77_18375, partial [Nannocystaceae bacterium]|nr:hypothetical protein [Nannocystaceae bacterium]
AISKAASAPELVQQDLGYTLQHDLVLYCATVLGYRLVSANQAVETFETEPAQRSDARGDITRGNRMGIVGGVVGGVFTVAGAVLITLGVRKRNTGGVSPMMDAQTMGVQWSGRF